MNLAADQFTNTNDNFTVTFSVPEGNDGYQKINPKKITITPVDNGKTYGDTDPELKATVPGIVPGDTINYTVVREEGEDVGTYTMSIVLGENPNYTITTGTGTFTIKAKAVTLAANDNSKTYGDTDPQLTATPSGLVGEDTLNYTVKRVEGEDVGTYRIYIVLGSNPNYEVSTSDAVFTINPKTITVTPIDNSKTYGDTDPELKATVNGAVGDDTINYTVAREEGEDVGTYTMSIVLGENPNYTITTGTGTFTINPKKITITPQNAEKTYGEEDPELTATVNGAVGDDTINYTVVREEGEDVGTYTISVVPGSNPNYTITTGTATFTINQLELTITITGNNDTKSYNGEDQNVNGYSADADSSFFDESKVGYYGTAVASRKDLGTSYMNLDEELFYYSDDNIDPTFVVDEDGWIEITRAKVTVKADNKSKMQNTGDPALTATVTGLFGNDTITYSISRASGEAPGYYTITPSGEEIQDNYEVTYQTGVLTIIKVEEEIITPVDPDPDPPTPPTPDPEPEPTPEPTPEPKPVDIDTDPTPTALNKTWALVNFILTIAAALITIGTISTIRRKKEDEEETEEDKENAKRNRAKWLTLIPAVAAVVIFLITEDMSSNMVLVDNFTILMAAIAVADVAIAYLTRNPKKEQEYERETITVS